MREDEKLSLKKADELSEYGFPIGDSSQNLDALVDAFDALGVADNANLVSSGSSMIRWEFSDEVAFTVGGRKFRKGLFAWAFEGWSFVGFCVLDKVSVWRCENMDEALDRLRAAAKSMG